MTKPAGHRDSGAVSARHGAAARVRSVLDAVRGSYWFLPTMMAAAAGIGAVALLAIDRAGGGAFLEEAGWIRQTDADGTRAVLSVIAGSMITVTGVVFSITIVALTLASSQFGPRLLRTFLRDRSNQVAFGVFVSTFLYSLLVLRSVTSDDVPHLASTVAVILVLASLFVLIYFIHHTASAIQASSVISAVAAEIDEQMTSLFPESIGRGDEATTSAEEQALLERLREDGAVVRAPASGFVRLVDETRLLRLTKAHDVAVSLSVRPGDFVCEDEPMARAGPANRVTDALAAALADCLVLGEHRSAVQDLGFLTGQLAEIAIRALSPGVNDPRTAMDCIERLGAVVRRAAGRRMPAAARHDDGGRLRVVAPPATFEQVAGSCLDAVRRHGAGHVEVVVKLLYVIGRAGEDAPAARRRVLARQADETIRAFALAATPTARDRHAVDQAFEAASNRLAG